MAVKYSLDFGTGEASTGWDWDRLTDAALRGSHREEFVTEIEKSFEDTEELVSALADGNIDGAWDGFVAKTRDAAQRFYGARSEKRQLREGREAVRILLGERAELRLRSGASEPDPALTEQIRAQTASVRVLRRQVRQQRRRRLADLLRESRRLRDFALV